MAERRAVIRLATDGKAQVKQDLVDIGNSGKASFDGLGAAGEAAANRATRAFDQATAAIEAAQRRQSAAAAKLAAITPQSATQMRIGDATGTGFSDWEGSARRSADAFRALQVEQDRMEAKARAIKAAIDPLTVATDRYNAELADMRALQAAGHLTADELGAAELRLKASFDQATASMVRQTGQSNAQRAAIQNVGFQVQDFTVQVVGGTSVLRAFALQFPQAAGALTGFEGKLGAVGAFLNGPWGIALVVGSTLLAGFADKLFTSASAAEKMADAQKNLPSVLDRTTGRIIEQNAQLIRNAQLLAQQAGQGARDTFARRQTAFQDSVRDFYDPALTGLANQIFAGEKGAVDRFNQRLEELRRQNPAFRTQYVDLATKRLTELMQSGRDVQQLSAQERLLSGQGRAGDAGRAFGEFNRQSGTDFTLLNAQAKLAAGGLTDLEKAQTNLTVAREKYQAQVKAGTLTEQQYTAAIAPFEGAVRKAEAAEKAATASRAAHRKETTEASKAAREYLQSIRELERAVDPAAANRRVADVLREDVDQALKAKDITEEQASRYRQAIWVREYEQNAEEDAKRRRQLLDQVGLDTGPLADITDPKTIEQWSKSASKAVNLVRSDVLELRAAGRDFVDNVLNENAWRSWGDLGKTVINEIRSEFLKLALFNPLRNLILGGNSPTLSTLTGLFSGGSSISTALPAVGADGLFAGVSAPHFASGTNYAPGGLAWVGEDGPELLSLPRGSRVRSAAQSRQMAAANDGGSRISVEVIPSDMFEVRVREIATPVAVAAGQQAMVGGAGLARQQAVRDQRYMMGRR